MRIDKVKTEQKKISDASEKNNRIRLYNQFPRCFHSIEEMKRHLIHIKAMDYTHVWINPIQDTEQNSYFRFTPSNPRLPPVYVQNNLITDNGKNKIKKPTGSLYAMRDSKKFAYFMSTINFIDKEKYDKVKEYPESDIEAIQAYTALGKKLGLRILFDLVVNQVSIESPLYKEHPNWFREYDEYKKKRQNLVPFGPGCAHFAFDNEDVKEEIFKFWKKYISRYIKIFKFHGVRIDAVKHIPVDVQKKLYEYIYKAFHKTHGKNENPVIFVELLEKNLDYQKHIKPLVQVNQSNHRISYITNSLNYLLVKGQFGLENCNAPSTKGLLKVAPTIGFPGSHDTWSLYNRQILDLKSNSRNTTIHDDIQKNAQVYAIHMKKRMAMIALSSNGGWCLMAGDEFALPGNRLVWDMHELKSNFEKKWGASDAYDFRDFICKLNHCIGLLPNPTEDDWIEPVFFKPKPNLMTVLLHHCKGFDYNKTNVIFINLVDNPGIKLSQNNINNIGNLIGQQHYNNFRLAKNCFLNAIKHEHAYIIGEITLPKSCNAKKITVSFKENLDKLKKKFLQSPKAPRFIGRNSSTLFSKSNLKVPQIKGLKYCPVPGDGQCLYHAVALYMGIEASTLRAVVAQYMKDNTQSFSDFLKPLLLKGQTMLNYLEDIQRGLEWPDNIEIFVLMTLLNRPIVIINSEGNISNAMDFKDFENEEPIFIYYNGHNHYDGFLLDTTQEAGEILKQLRKQSHPHVKSSKTTPT